MSKVRKIFNHNNLEYNFLKYKNNLEQIVKDLS